MSEWARGEVFSISGFYERAKLPFSAISAAFHHKASWFLFFISEGINKREV